MPDGHDRFLVPTVPLHAVVPPPAARCLWRGSRPGRFRSAPRADTGSRRASCRCGVCRHSRSGRGTSRPSYTGARPWGSASCHRRSRPGCVAAFRRPTPGMVVSVSDRPARKGQVADRSPRSTSPSVSSRKSILAQNLRRSKTRGAARNWPTQRLPQGRQSSAATGPRANSASAAGSVVPAEQRLEHRAARTAPSRRSSRVASLSPASSSTR